MTNGQLSERIVDFFVSLNREHQLDFIKRLDLETAVELLRVVVERHGEIGVRTATSVLEEFIVTELVFRISDAAIKMELLESLLDRLSAVRNDNTSESG